MLGSDVVSKFRVSPEEKRELLEALREADKGGSLPFDEAMADVEEMTKEILRTLERDASTTSAS